MKLLYNNIDTEMKKLIYYLFFLGVQILVAQDTKNVLFLGNSYTNVNNLPLLTQQVAASTGNTLNFEKNTPGGYTLLGHATNVTSQNKIKASNWDYVVLQEQSQKPSFPDSQVITDVYPYASKLNDSILKYNPCAKTTFYMTWGRENGDVNNCPGWPPVCTYAGMDDLLRQRYQTMANDNNGICSPVGAVWRYLRDNHPTLDLYANDGSHPSIRGSYAGALTFYCTIFKKDPTLVTFNATLSNTDATIIKNAVKTIVFNDFQEWNIGNYDPVANFSNTNNNETFTFTNNSQNAVTYLWDFGDGNTDTQENPTHTYTSTGNFTVNLTVTKCEKTHTFTTVVTVNNLGVSDENTISNQITMIENPSQNYLQLTSSLFNQKQYTINIYSVIGQKVISKATTLSVLQKIAINSLSSDVYLIQVLEKDNIIYESKFVKK